MGAHRKYNYINDIQSCLTPLLRAFNKYMKHQLSVIFFYVTILFGVDSYSYYEYCISQ